MKEDIKILKHLEPKNMQIQINMDISLSQWLEFPNDKVLVNYQILKTLCRALDSNWQVEPSSVTMISHTDLLRTKTDISISAKTL